MFLAMDEMESFEEEKQYPASHLQIMLIQPHTDTGVSQAVLYDSLNKEVSVRPVKFPSEYQDVDRILAPVTPLAIMDIDYEDTSNYQLVPLNSRPISSEKLVRPNKSVGRCPLCGQAALTDDSIFMIQNYFKVLGQAQEESREGFSSDRSFSVSSPVHNPFKIYGNEDQSELRDLPSGLLNTGYYHRFFIEISKVGQGSFGAVFLCR